MDKSENIFQLPVILMGIFLVITFLVALLPAFTQILEGAKASNSLNCPGYNANSTDPRLSYNASLPSQGIGCMAISMYIPYIVFGVLIASVAVLFGQQINFGGQSTQQQGYY